MTGFAMSNSISGNLSSARDYSFAAWLARVMERKCHAPKCQMADKVQSVKPGHSCAGRFYSVGISLFADAD
jgi:hypothetical protein